MSKRKAITGLLDEPPISVYPSLAKRAGINKACILQQVHFLAQVSEIAQNERNFQDDRYWVYNTYADWHRKYFPWIAAGTIQRLFLSLEKDGILLSTTWHGDPSGKTKAYAIDYDAWPEWFTADDAPQNAVGDTAADPSQNVVDSITKCGGHGSQNVEVPTTKSDGSLYIETEIPRDSITETPPTPGPDGGDAPHGGGEDTDPILEMLLREFDKAKVWRTTAEQAIDAHGMTDALALLYACLDADKPGALLTTKLRENAKPPDAFVRRAELWILQRRAELTVNVDSEPAAAATEPPMPGDHRESEASGESDPATPLPGEVQDAPASEPAAPEPADIPAEIGDAWAAVLDVYRRDRDAKAAALLARSELLGIEHDRLRVRVRGMAIDALYLQHNTQLVVERVLSEAAGRTLTVSFVSPSMVREVAHA